MSPIIMQFCKGRVWSSAVFLDRKGHPKAHGTVENPISYFQECCRVVSCRHVPCRTSFCYVSVRALLGFPTCRYVSCPNFLCVGTCRKPFLVARVMHAGLEPACPAFMKRATKNSFRHVPTRRRFGHDSYRHVGKSGTARTDT